jgi:hypothetical protein
MAFPSRAEIKDAVLSEIAGDGREHGIHDAIGRLGQRFQLSANELVERYASGKPMFDTKVRYAKKTLIMDGLLKSTGWGRFRLNENASVRPSAQEAARV